MGTPITTSTNLRCAWLLDWFMSDVDNWAVTTAPFNITANGLNYLASPLPLSIGRLSSTAKVSDSELSISFSAVNLDFKALALNNILTGRFFNVYRVIFNDDYSINQILKRYSGVISGVSFDDDYPGDVGGKSAASFTTTFLLKPLKEVLRSRVAGRFTTRADMQRFFANDTSMNQIPVETGRVITLGRD